MANSFITLPVPAGDGFGAWTDVSSQGPQRTVSVDGGAFAGSIYLECSNDGQVSAAPAAVGPFIAPTMAPQTFTQGLNFMRVRRAGSGGVGTPTVTIGAPAAVANVFGAMTVPAIDGVGAAFDLTAGGDVNTFNVEGPYSGQILIETSTDGVNFSPTLLFTTFHGVGQTVVGVLSAARVRRRGVTSATLPLVSVGSQATGGAAGGGFPGYSAAPPAVAAASSAGVSALVSRGDHTHRGALESGSYTVPVALNASGILAQTVVAGVATLAIVALPTSFPGFGGAPPAVASASAAGAAATASRSDHTHALDLVTYAPSVAGMQATGVIQQTYAAPNATPAAFNVATGLIPFGAAGVLAASANLSFATATDTVTINHATGTNNAIDITNADATSASQTQSIRYRRNGVTQISQQFQSAPALAGSLVSTVTFLHAVTAGGLGSRFAVFTSQPILGVWMPTNDVAIGNHQVLANAATNGFVWLPQMAGAPTSPATQVPTPVQGNIAVGVGFRLPIFQDNTNKRQYGWFGDLGTAAGAWRFSSYDNYSSTPTRIPFGGAVAGDVTDSANFAYDAATGRLTLAGFAGGTNGSSIALGAGPAGTGLPIGGGAINTVAFYINDNLGSGQGSMALDDFYFGQGLIGYSNLSLRSLTLGAGGAGNQVSLQYGANQGGAGTDALTVEATAGDIAALTTFRVGTPAFEGLQVTPNAAGSDVFVGYQGAIAVGATHGYPYMPNLATTPTGAPNAFGGAGVPFGYDANDHLLFVRNIAGGQWEAIPAANSTAAAGAGVWTTTNLPAGFGTTVKWWSFKGFGGATVVVPYFTNP